MFTVRTGREDSILQDIFIKSVRRKFGLLAKEVDS
jgi:hypothetical protein